LAVLLLFLGFFNGRMELSAAGPTIGTPPTPVTATLGTPASFLILASGNGTLTYQWKRNGTALEGATANIYSIVSVGPGDAGVYTVTVSDVDGSVESSPGVALTVEIPVDIGTQPAGAVINQGGSHTMVVTPTGTGPFTYQWMRDSVAIPGATSATYTVSNALSADAAQYEVAVSNVLGGVTYLKKSSPAVVSVIVPPTITGDPVAAIVAVGAPVKLTVSASGTLPLLYQWRRNAVNLSGATAGSYSLASAQTFDSGTYTVVVSNAAGTTTSQAAVLSVEIPPSITTQPLGATIAVNTGTTFSVTADGTSPLSYQWRRNGTNIAGATAASYSLASAQTTESGSYSVLVSNNVGTVTSQAAVLSVEIPPSINTQPLGATIAVNTGTTFSVTADGTTPLTYQWRRNGTNIAGATAASYSLASAQTTESGSYSVLVSNNVGTVASQAAVLSVEIPPSINTQPLGSTIAVNTGTTFSVTASGTGPFTYQWRRNLTELAGATAASFALPSAQAADSGTYTVVVRNAVGTAISEAAVLTVLLPVNVTTPPAARTVEVGGTVSFSVSQSGSEPLSYQWLKDSTPIGGATGAVFTLTNASLSSAGSYSVVLSNPVSSQTSAPARLSVAPLIITAVADTTATVGVPVTLSVGAVGSGTLTYQWQNNFGEDIAGATGAAYTLASPKLSEAGIYRVKVRNEAGAAFERTSAARLTVAEPLVLNGILVSPVSGGAPESTATKTSFASFTADIAQPPPKIATNGYAVSDSPISYQWFLNGTAITSGGTSNMLKIASVTSASTGSYSVVATTAAGTVAAGPVLFTALKPVTIVTPPQSATLNVGSLWSLTVGVTGTGPFGYQWLNSLMKPIDGATSATLTFPSISDADKGDYYVRVRSYYQGALTSEAYSNPGATIKINPPPVMTRQPESAFAPVGGTVSFSAAAQSIPPYSYQWHKDGAAISGATGSTYSLAGVQLSSAGSYSCVISTPMGSVTSKAAALTVFGPPSITTPLVAGTVVLGGSYTFTVAAAGPGPLTYQWRKAGAAVAAGSYSFKPGLFTWHQAKADAEASGGHLATISNAAEWTELFTQLSNAGHAGKTAWLGAYQPDGSSEPGGGWTWLGGEPVVFEKWRSQKPSEKVASTTEQYAQQYLFGTISSTGNWDNSENAAAAMGGYVLEIESSNPSHTVHASSPSAAGIYEVVIYSPGGRLTSQGATLTVLEPPDFVSPPQHASLQVGSPLTLNTIVAGTAPFSYQWLKDGFPVAGATGPSLQRSAVGFADAGNYTLSVTNQAGSLTSSSANVVVFEPVAITTQPVSATLNPNATAVFSVSATFTVAPAAASSLTYKWLKNGQAVDGGTGSVLTIPSVATAHAGTYTCQVHNSASYGAPVTSAPAVLSVNSYPTVSGLPVSKVIFTGSLLALRPTVGGTAPFTYQWQKNGQPIPGQTSQTLDLPNIQPADQAAYSVVVNNVTGRAASSSSTFVTVVDPVIITVPPLATAVAAGGTLRLSVTATGTEPITYQWYKDGAPIPSATAANYFVPFMTASNAGSYFVTARNEAASATSPAAAVTMQTPVVITSQPSSGTVALGGSYALGVVAGGTAPLTYQWFKDGVLLAGANGPTLVITGALASDGAQYTVAVTNAVSTSTSTPATLTVLQPLAVTTQPAALTLTAGMDAAIRVVATGSAPITYQWRKNGANIPSATAASLALLAAQPMDSGSYDVVISNPVGSVTSTQALLTVCTPLSISSEPSGASVLAGNTFTTGVSVSGTGPFTYQWRRNGVNLPGATSASLTLAGVLPPDAGAYDVVVSSPVNSATSQKATLLVLEPVTITTQPTPLNLNVGGSGTLRVTATGTSPLTYQWRKGGSAIPGATSATYPFASAQFTDAASYEVLVSNPAGSLLSSPAAVTVATPPVVVNQPVGGYVATGGSLNLSVTAAGTAPLAYQWRKAGANLAGATGATYTLAGAQPADSGAYDVVVTNTAGTATSVQVNVAVSDPIGLTSQPAPATIAVGASATFSVSGIGTGPLLYQWSKDGVPIPGANASSLTIANATAADAATYAATLSNAAQSVTSNGALLSVLTPPSVSVQPLGGSVAVGASRSLSVTATGSAPLTFQWRKAGTALTGEVGPTLSVAAAQMSDAGTYDVVVSNSAGTTTSLGAVLNVMNGVAFASQPVGLTVAAGSLASFSASVSGDGPITYQWHKNGVPLPGATGASLVLAQVQAADAAAYSIVAGNAVSTATSDTANLTVLTAPIITSNPTGGTVLRGSPRTLAVVAAGSAPLSYQWFLGTSPLPGANSSSYAIASAEYADEGDYSVVVSNLSGSATSTPTNLVVLQAPEITIQPAANTTGVTTDTINLSVTATGKAPLTYQWRKNGVPVVGATSSTLQILSAMETHSGSYDVLVTNAGGMKTSAPALLTIIDPVKITKQPTPSNVLVGGTHTFSVEATGTPVLSYQWRKGGTPLAGGTGASYKIANANTSEAGFYDVIVTNAAGPVVSKSVSLSVGPGGGGGGSGNLPPFITTQPAALPHLRGGDSFSFSVEAGGTPTLLYQWKKNGVDLSGGTAATLAVAVSQLTDAGTYTVEVRNEYGYELSEAVVLKILEPVIITSPPASATVRLGSRATLSVTATGAAPLAYQWRKGGVDLPGATASSLVIDFAQTTDSGSYTVVVANAVDTKTSASAMLVIDDAVWVTSQPQPTSAILGGSATFSVSASGAAPFSYQWRKNGAPIEGATASVLPIANAQNTDAAEYSVVVTNAVSTSTSTGASLVVYTPVTITAHPQAAVVNEGAGTTLSVAATGTEALTYQWSRDGVQIAGATSASYTLAPATTSQAGSYTATVSNPAGSVTSNPAELLVRSAPRIVTQPVSAGVVLSAGTTLSVGASGHAPLAYQWRKNGVAVAGATAATLTLASAVEASAGVYDVVVSNMAGTATSQTATVTVHTPLTILTHPAAASVVLGGSAFLSASVSGSEPVTYQWRKDGAPIAGATGNAFSLASVTALDAGSYSVVATNPAGSVTTSAANLTVGSPVVLLTQPVSLGVVPGTGATFSVAATGTAPLSYQWRKNSLAIPGATGASYTIGSAQPLDGGSYDVVVANVVGPVTSSGAMLTVFTAPALATEPSPQTVLSGSTATFQVTATGSEPLSYQWSKNGVHIFGATSSTLVLANSQPTDEASYSVAVSNAAGSVTSTAAALTVLTPPVVVTPPLSVAVQAGQAASLSVNVSGTAPITYQWRHAGVNVVGGTGAVLSIPAALDSDAGKYDVVATNPAGSVTSIEATLTVRPPILFTTQPISGSISQGESYIMSVAVSGANPLAYQWRKDGAPIPGATAETWVVFNAQHGDAGDYSVTVSNSSGSATSNVARLEVIVPVIIVEQPVGGVATRGGSFSFSVGVTGSAPLSYQWLKDGAPIAGGTGAVLTLASAQYSDAGVFSVSVANAINTATSNPVPLTVVDAVEITSHPSSNAVLKGSRSLLSVEATGTEPLVYQWRRDGVNIEGATASSYLFTQVSAEEAGNYDVVVGNLAGPVQSQIATVFVVDPPAITQNPLGGVVLEGGTFTFQVSAIGSLPLTYQWLKGGDAVSAGSVAATASVSAHAGSAGAGGTTDGPAAVARFARPTGVALDFSGNLYVADTSSHTIRKTSPSGVVSTFAGTSGVAGSQDGQGTGARFASPTGVAVDAVGNVFVADSGNHVIRKINPSGRATTFAGSAGTLGFANGRGNAACFNNPTAIALDDFGNVYVGDDNHVIRKISPAGDVIGFAGSPGAAGASDGLGAAARFDSPRSLAVDGSGTVFVADSGNHTIRKITAGGLVSTWAGSAGVVGATDGLRTSARFQSPGGLTLDESGNLFVSDSGNHTVRRITAGGSVNTVAGLAETGGSSDGVGAAARLKAPLGIATDGGSLVYVADSGNQTVRKLQVDGSAAGNLDVLKLSNATPAVAGDYSVRVSNAAGSTTSSLASLEVLAGVDITTQPQGGGVVLGGTLRLSVTATGAQPFAYQWQKNGVDLPGQTAAVLTLSNADAATYADYTVRVSNAVSAEVSATATVFFVTVPSIQVQPLGGIAGLNETFLLDVTADGTGPLQYSWRRSGTLVSSGTTSARLMAPVQTTDEGSYVVTVTNLYGSASSVAAEVKVIDFSLPLNIAVPDGNQVVYSGTLGYRGGLEIWRDGTGNIDFTVPLVVPKQITYFSTGTTALAIDQSIGAATSGIVQHSNTSGLNLSMGTLTVNATGTALISEGAAPFTIQQKVLGTGTLSVEANTTGPVTLSGVVNPSGPFENHGTGSGLVLVSGTLGPAVTSVTQNSWSSILQLEGANTYSGPTIVKAGSLVVRANGALGDTQGNTTVEKDAVLDLRDVTYTVGESLAVRGGTVLVSAGTSSFAGGIGLSGGTATFDIEGASLTVEGPLSGDDNFVKTGPGKLILKGPGTVTGQVSVLAGTLTGAGPGSLGAGMVLVSSGATLELGGKGTATYENSIMGGGTLVKTGTDMVVLTGDNKFSGGTVIAEGSLMLSGTASLGIAAVTVAPQAMLVLNPTEDTVLPNAIYGPVTSANTRYKVVWGGGPGYPGGGAIGGPKAELVGSANIYAFVGQFLTRQISASNDPTGFEATPPLPRSRLDPKTGLPPGLVLDPATGIITGIPTLAGVDTAVLVLTNPGGKNSIRINFIITLPTPVPGAPTVTEDPDSIPVPLGGSATLSAKIQSDMPFTYRWKKNGSYVGPVYSGAGGSSPQRVSLSLRNVSEPAQGLYTVFATSDFGICESNPAMLTVEQPTARFGAASLLRQGRSFDLSKAVPAIPVDLKTVAANDYFVVKVSVDPGAKYFWYYSSLQSTSWMLLPDQTWPVFDFSDPLVPKLYGGFVRLKVVSAKGSVQTLMFRVEAFSSPLPGFAKEPPELFITSHPFPLDVDEMGYANFSVFADGMPVWYEWFREDPVTGVSSHVHSSSIPYWSLGPVRVSDAGVYYVVVRDYWNKTAESLKAKLTVNPD
jgi:autotransporter-associated beta strand protein